VGSGAALAGEGRVVGVGTPAGGIEVVGTADAPGEVQLDTSNTPPTIHRNGFDLTCGS
jgi:hypothetical protein